MNFSNTCAYCLYKIYNQLAIHDAPLFVLDLFIPILTTETWKQTLQAEIKNAKVFQTVEEFFKDLRNERIKRQCKKSKWVPYNIYNNTASNCSLSIYITADGSNTFYNNTCTASNDNGIWLYGSTDC